MSLVVGGTYVAISNYAVEPASQLRNTAVFVAKSAQDDILKTTNLRDLIKILEGLEKRNYQIVDGNDNAVMLKPQIGYLKELKKNHFEWRNIYMMVTRGMGLREHVEEIIRTVSIGY